ncbi:PCP reductase family protein [Anabaenopsis elenkinii]|jgi:hypothetical protein
MVTILFGHQSHLHIKIKPSQSMSQPIKWTAEAETQLKEIPFFVRPFARKKIETYAQENSISLITLEIYELVKKQFN